MKSFLPYTHQTIEDDDIALVSQALRGDLITRGPFVEQFEQAVANYCQAQYAVAFNSASTALAATCFAADLNRHDRFFTSPNTFVASAGPAFQMGASPVFIDIDRTTGNIDLDSLGLNLNRSSTRGRDVIMVVHYAGIPVDMNLLDRHVKNQKTIVIEDAAHALGSTYTDGQKVGSCPFSQMTVFSFHPAKTVTTGEGGVVTTNDETLWRKLQLYRNNGIVRDSQFLIEPPNPWYYEVQALTGNYNFTEMQGALGVSQMAKVDRFVNKRRSLVAHYRKHLSRCANITCLESSFDKYSAHHLMVAQIDFAACGKSRAHVMEALKEKGIGTQVHYIPLYRHPYFVERMGNIAEYFPEAEAFYAQALTLPLFPNMTMQDVERVCSSLKDCLK